MSFILDCIKGIAIGAGAILPGISSGVLCVIFGIYEKLVDCILNFFKDFKTNIKFIFPILIGVAIGVILFGNILRYLFENYPMQTCFCFIGIILGGIPALFKNANFKTGFRLHYLSYTFISFFLTILLIIIENNISNNFIACNNSLYLILSGFVMSVGIVVPGVSSTVLLMLMGTYNTYLNAVSSINLQILIPMGFGLFLGGLLFLKITRYCLENFHTQTYYTIIGFVLGSIFVLYPGFAVNLQGIFCIISLFGGIFISIRLEKRV